MKKLTTTIVVIVTLLLIGGGLYWHHQHTAIKPTLAIKAIPVKLQTVAMHNIPLKLQTIGVVVAPQTIILKAKADGDVTAIDFRSGEQVSKGQLLLQLDDRSAKANLAQEQANVEKLDSQYQRFVQLQKADAQAISADDMAQKRGELAIANAKLQDAKEQLADTRIVAPFAGRISNPQASQATLYVGGQSLSQTTQLSIGSYVKQGDALAILSNSANVQVQYQVPEKYAQQLATGQTVIVKSAAYPQQAFNGKVIYVSPIVLPNSQAYSVRASIINDAQPLDSGMSVSVEQTLQQQQQVLAVPGISLVPSLTGYAVYSVKDSKVLEIPVTVGQRYDTLVQITSGLKVGDRIITDGIGNVHPGATIKVVS